MKNPFSGKSEKDTGNVGKFGSSFPIISIQSIMREMSISENKWIIVSSILMTIVSSENSMLWTAASPAVKGE